MAARLEKVRQRKQLKQPVMEEKPTEEEGGKSVADSEDGEKKEEGEGVDSIAAMIDSELGRAREKAEKGERGSEGQEGGRMKKPYVRPWDKGKG